MFAKILFILDELKERKVRFFWDSSLQTNAGVAKLTTVVFTELWLSKRHVT